ncbi:MAG: hypothetical protein CMH64_02870 [Nanoarchaeota archaeon]|nr:hypothetical protein [Nanoarchaeota archaeon]|tara:strand:+ start:824 stop:1348 length:525 start_codon:yes stop_codon:yes gene_type:complete
MTYKDAIKESMENLAQDKNTVFLGYNISFGSQAYGTLNDIAKEQKIETPVAENLMIGLTMGMALEGYRPVLFFERHDFMLNAMDGIINHLDKIESMSKGQFKCPVIIRAVIGSKEPLHPGPQHTQDFTKIFKETLSFPVYELENPEDIIKYYKIAQSSPGPIMLIEKRELYDRF